MTGHTTEPVRDAAVPERVGVVGGGRMGSGIAHAFLLARAVVTVIESDEARAGTARETIRSALSRSRERGQPTGGAEQRLTVTPDRAALGGSGLVVEAVPEIIELKLDILQAICAQVDDDCLVASNTSSLSLAGLEQAVTAPRRFLGMHFFNPVPASALVEIVVAPATDPVVVATVQRIVHALGKTPITVADSPGFASSRLGVLLGLEAIRMVQDGVAAPADIDAAMTLGYKHPVGPLRLTDLVGLDVRLDIAEYLAGQLGPRFEPPQLLRDKVSRGELGRKTGRGFFDWPDD